MMLQTVRTLTEAVRNPALPAPAGLDPQRLAVYRRLVGNNLMSLFSANFPVARTALGDSFRPLVEDFLREHTAHTPLFTELPMELLQYVAERADPRWPWLAELLHYEHIELELSLSTASVDLPPPGCVALAANVAPLAYQYPVQQIRADWQPSAPGALPTLLLAHRDHAGNVQFHALEAAAYLLLSQLQRNGPKQRGQLLDTVLDTLQLDPTHAAGPANLALDGLIALGVVLAA